MNKENFEIAKIIDEELDFKINVSPNEDNIWLTQAQMALLFGRDKSVISRHIKKILLMDELDENSVVEESLITGNDGKKYKTKIYNLEMVISVGYRVKSKKGILFRRWANKILKEYLLKGYVVNENRVTASNENYIELRNKVININNILIKQEENILDKEYTTNKIFYNDQFYDRYSLIKQIYGRANNEIIIIDNNIDRILVDGLVSKKNNVKVIIYTSINSTLLENDIKQLNKQYENLEVKYTTKVNDRYIIIDQDKLYHLGYSSKEPDKKIYTIIESDSNLIKELLNNI